MRVLRLVTLLVWLAPATSAARTAEIRGTVFLSARAAELDSLGRHSPYRSLQRGVCDAVVYLEQIPNGTEKSLKRHVNKHADVAHVAQRRQSFEPRVTAVVVGGSVEFANCDTLYHNTFSVSSACKFDLGRYPPGHTDTVRFPQRGVVNLHCEIHPDMVGYVVVVPNHAYARPDSLGAFRLPRLPHGEYVLRVWHPRLGELSRTLSVPDRGDVRTALVYGS
jgi:plastocyanin